METKLRRSGKVKSAKPHSAKNAEIVETARKQTLKAMKTAKQRLRQAEKEIDRQIRPIQKKQC